MLIKLKNTVSTTFTFDRACQDFSVLLSVFTVSHYTNSLHLTIATVVTVLHNSTNCQSSIGTGKILIFIHQGSGRGSRGVQRDVKWGTYGMLDCKVDS